MATNSFQWAVTDSSGEPMSYTLSDSADDAVQMVVARVGGRSYEDITRLGFRLVRVTVSIEVAVGVSDYAR